MFREEEREDISVEGFPKLRLGSGKQRWSLYGFSRKGGKRRKRKNPPFNAKETNFHFGYRGRKIESAHKGKRTSIMTNRLGRGEKGSGCSKRENSSSVQKRKRTVDGVVQSKYHSTGLKVRKKKSRIQRGAFALEKEEIDSSQSKIFALCLKTNGKKKRGSPI